MPFAQSSYLALDFVVCKLMIKKYCINTWQSSLILLWNTYDRTTFFFIPSKGDVNEHRNLKWTHRVWVTRLTSLHATKYFRFRRGARRAGSCSDELYPLTAAGRKSQSVSILTDIMLKYDSMVFNKLGKYECVATIPVLVLSIVWQFKYIQ